MSPDPYEHDPQRWGVSMAQSAELLLACLNAAGATSVVEVGAYAGDLTRVLVDWAAGGGATITAVDPAPQPGLEALASGHERLRLVRESSLTALARLPVPDAVVIDGDHNHWTVSEELRLVSERAGADGLPLLLFHDVCWPHGRRDDYFAPDAVPAERRQPIAGDRGGLAPGNPGLVPGGLPYPRSAATEGGPGNGVLTAIEDFAVTHEDVRVVVVPVFFGFGASWDERRPWAPALARVLDPFDRHPVLERLEANRVHHLAEAHRQRAALWAAQERQTRLEAVLQRLLDSRAFDVAERLSRWRVRAGIGRSVDAVSKAELRRALAERRR